MINGYRTTQAIHVAASLRLSDALADGPRTPAELAAATGTDAPTLHRLLRALASIGVYEELPDGRFASTPLGDELRSTASRGLVGWAAFVGRPSHWQAWGALAHSVRTGENAFTTVHGRSVWEHRARDPEDNAVFDAAMTGMSRYVSDAVVDAYDFGAYGTVVDVGGGRGAMLAAILHRYPTVRGVLFDQPHVVDSTGDLLAGAGVDDRCAVVAGDVFTGVPDGGHVYLMKSVLHDWRDEDAVEILRACARAMGTSAVLLIAERVLPAPPYPSGAASTAFSDLNMLVGPGGKERTVAEFERLLVPAGLHLTRVVPTASDVALLEARADATPGP